jgi:hypothetical protein
MGGARATPESSSIAGTTARNHDLACMRGGKMPSVGTRRINSGFEVVGVRDAGAGVLRAFARPDCEFCLIGDSFEDGGTAVLLTRARFIADLVASVFDAVELRREWIAQLLSEPQGITGFVQEFVARRVADRMFGATKNMDHRELIPSELVSSYLEDVQADPAFRIPVCAAAGEAEEQAGEYRVALEQGRVVGVDVVSADTTGSQRRLDEGSGDEPFAAPQAEPPRPPPPPQVMPSPMPGPAVQPRPPSDAKSKPDASGPPDTGESGLGMSGIGYATSGSGDTGGGSGGGGQTGIARDRQSPDQVANAVSSLAKAFVAHPRLDAGDARPGARMPFTVGFSATPDAAADAQARIRIDAPTEGDTILVIASAEGATIEEPSFAVLPLEIAASHEFTAHIAEDAQECRLRATYLYRNKPVGNIVKTLPLLSERAPRTRACIEAEPRLTNAADMAGIDLVLMIQRAAAGRLSFRATVRGSDEVHGPFDVVLDDAARFARTLAGLRGMYGDSGAGAFEELKVIGQQIVALFPRPLLEEVIAPLLTRPGPPPAVLIMTDEPFVPWELARLSGTLTGCGEPAFFGEVASIGRWWTGDTQGGPRSARDIRHLSAVAATEYAANVTYDTLEHAVAEREWLSNTFGATCIEAKYPDIDQWLDAKPRPAGHLGHLALHGFSDAGNDSQGLVLADGKLLTPNRLAGEFYAGDTPRFEVLFLNACQVGTAGERLGRIAGFPGALLAGGASAFIGPLWEVDDGVARQVAEHFYASVLNDGVEVGLAMQTLREELGADSSITPWAYVYYGHPRLKLTLQH